MEQGSAVREAVEDFTCRVDGIGLGSKAGGVGSRHHVRSASCFLLVLLVLPAPPPHVCPLPAPAPAPGSTLVLCVLLCLAIGSKSHWQGFLGIIRSCSPMATCFGKE